MTLLKCHQPRSWLRVSGTPLTQLVNDIHRDIVAYERWLPAVDIREDEHEFELHLDLPGVDAKAVEVTLDGHTLTIKGERKREADEEGVRYARKERVHGPFERRFSLPDTVDEQGIHASGEHGVLRVVLPKKLSAQPRRIDVLH